MKCQLSNTIYGLKLAMEKNDFERLKSSTGKKLSDFVAVFLISAIETRYKETNLHISISEMEVCQVHSYKISR